MTDKTNVVKQPDFEQVCVWPGTLVGDEVEEFVKFMLGEFGVRVQYLEEIKTKPDVKDGFVVRGTGDRNDLFFAVHKDDIGKFAVRRLAYGIRWIEDALAPHNHSRHLYPTRVSAYQTWALGSDDAPC